MTPLPSTMSQQYCVINFIGQKLFRTFSLLFYTYVCSVKPLKLPLTDTTPPFSPSSGFTTSIICLKSRRQFLYEISESSCVHFLISYHIIVTEPVIFCKEFFLFT